MAISLVESSSAPRWSAFLLLGLGWVALTGGYWLLLFCPSGAHPWNGVFRVLGLVMVFPTAILCLLGAVASSDVGMAVGFAATLYLCWEVLRGDGPDMA
jgi:hypothetical protein